MVNMLKLYCVSLIASIALISRGYCQSGTPCPSVIGEPSCVCNHPDGLGKIDATPLGVPGPDAPRFKLVTDPIGYDYSFNPCHPYSHELCANVHSCQTSQFNPEVTYDIASGGTEEMYIDPDGIPYLFYTAPGGKRTYVYLHCTDDKDPRLEAEGDGEVFFEYVFNVYSRDVCPGGKVPLSIAPGVVGILLMLGLIVGLVVYFVIGAIVMKTKYSAAGVDLIPNKTFWKSLPGLIKDGTLFVVSPCLSLKNPGYSEMKS